jgi:hypothetical protein
MQRRQTGALERACDQAEGRFIREDPLSVVPKTMRALIETKAGDLAAIIGSNDWPTE